MDLERGTVLVVEADAARQAAASEALRRGGFTVVNAQHAEHALTLLTDIAFDALVAAIELPRHSGIGLLETVREQAMPVPVIMTTTAPGLETAVSVMRCGAVDYLSLPMAPAELVARVDEAVRKSAGLRAMRGAQQHAAQLVQSAGALEAALSGTVGASSSSRLRAAPPSPEAPLPPGADQLRRLSPREREIALHLLQGNSVNDMAAALALSPNTVRNHVKSIFAKLGVHSQVALLSRLSGRSR